MLGRLGLYHRDHLLSQSLKSQSLFQQTQAWEIYCKLLPCPALQLRRDHAVHAVLGQRLSRIDLVHGQQH